MNTVQRAFELAATGNFRSIEDLRRKMRQENCEMVEAHLAGATIKRQLSIAIRQSKLAGTA